MRKVIERDKSGSAVLWIMDYQSWKGYYKSNSPAQPISIAEETEFQRS